LVEVKIEDENEQKTETKQEPKKCAACEDNTLMTVYGAALTACTLIDNDKEKKRCEEWADTLDPEKIESNVKVIEEVLRFDGGLDALKKHAMAFNIVQKQAIINVVEDMMAKKEQVPTDLMAAFKAVVNEKGV